MKFTFACSSKATHRHLSGLEPKEGSSNHATLICGSDFIHLLGPIRTQDCKDGRNKLCLPHRRHCSKAFTTCTDVFCSLLTSRLRGKHSQLPWRWGLPPSPWGQPVSFRAKRLSVVTHLASERQILAMKDASCSAWRHTIAWSLYLMLIRNLVCLAS